MRAADLKNVSLSGIFILNMKNQDKNTIILITFSIYITSLVSAKSSLTAMTAGSTITLVSRRSRLLKEQYFYVFIYHKEDGLIRTCLLIKFITLHNISKIGF